MKNVWIRGLMAVVISAILVGIMGYTILWPMAIDWGRNKNIERVYSVLVNYPGQPGALLREQLLQDGLAQRWTFEVVSHRILKDDDGHAVVIVPDPKRSGRGRMHVIFADTLVWSENSIPLHIALFRVGAMYDQWKAGRMKSFERMALGDNTPALMEDACEELFHAARMMARAQCHIELQFHYSFTHGELVGDGAVQAHQQACRTSLETEEGAQAFLDHLIVTDSYPNCTNLFRDYHLTSAQRASN